MLLDDLIFRLEDDQDDSLWDLRDECFRFYKTKALVEEYGRFLGLRRDFHPSNIFELGIWDGGSVAFWFELFRPRKHVAIDLAEREDSRYFSRYRHSRGLDDAIRTFWGTDQRDGLRLREIAAGELAGDLDLVIDDCSHLYPPTKASFEALFPLLRPGGLYILEDWSWAHWDEFQPQAHAWARQSPLTRLVFDIVEAIGTSNAIVSDLTVYKGFAVAERGPAEAVRSGSFSLDAAIQRRPVDRLSSSVSARAARLSAFVQQGLWVTKEASSNVRRAVAAARRPHE